MTKYIPAPFRALFWRLAAAVSPSWARNYKAMSYWDANYRREGGSFSNGWYQPLMLAIAGEPDGSFLANQVVADFGCGPRGSLCWATQAADRIGIDVLAKQYERFRTRNQSMRYVQSTEKRIPLPDGSVDTLFTVNALDHVVHLDAMCREMLRILKPGGSLIGAFNLGEPPRIQEPQTLTEERLQGLLFRQLTIERRVLAPAKESGAKRYGEHTLWVRATKPGKAGAA